MMWKLRRGLASLPWIFNIFLVILSILSFDSHSQVYGYKTAIEVFSCDDEINEIDRAKLILNLPLLSTLTDNRRSSETGRNLSVYTVNTDCYHCAKSWLATLPTTNSASQQCFSMWTPFAWNLYLISEIDGVEEEELYQLRYTFLDHGEYTLSITTSASASALETSLDATSPFVMSIDETKEGEDAMEPLYILLGVLAAIAVLAFGLPALYEHSTSFYTLTANNNATTTTQTVLNTNKVEEDNTTSTTPATAATPSSQSKKPQRLRSLDSFRGISLLLMIFVNYGGGGYWFFDHAAWNGLTMADLLFPWFMWIMGVSMALSFARLLPSDLLNASPMEIYTSPQYLKVWKRVIIRSIKLFLLGMFLANGYDYTTWRIPGVLQYFAASYLWVAATILLTLPYTQKLLRMKEEARCRRYQSLHQEITTSMLIEEAQEGRLGGEGMETVKHDAIKDYHAYDNDTRRKWWKWLEFEDTSILTSYRYELIIQGSILLVYLLVVLLGQAPGCPRGYNGPGGRGDHGDYHDCTGGIHRYIDLMLFTHMMIFHGETCRFLYGCIAYDPEGFMGMFTATVLTYLGLMTGRLFLHYRDNVKKIVQLMFYEAMVLLLLCGILCGFSREEGVIPVNKNLWSLSFICVCGGFGSLGLIICYLLIDVWKVWSGAPFYYLGMNSILLYMSHQLLADYFPFSFILFRPSHALLLTSNVVGVFSWVVIAYYFYKIKFFVKV